MQQDYLKHFYNQEHVREAVRVFLHATVDEELLDAAYQGKDVAGYKEAKEVIERMFSNLRNLYAEEKSNTKENKAR